MTPPTSATDFWPWLIGILFSCIIFLFLYQDRQREIDRKHHDETVKDLLERLDKKDEVFIETIKEVESMHSDDMRVVFAKFDMVTAALGNCSLKQPHG